jgi:hypothetical protein
MTVADKATRLLVFAKAPRAGEVKTRLVPRLGPEGAAALHARMIERTLVVAAEAAIGPIDLYGTPADDAFLCKVAAANAARVFDQGRGDLGSRMYRAFQRTLAGSRAAILIGTDCPALSVRHLRDAADALLRGERAVFVPVEDGGYALIGLRSVAAEFFEGIAWSTDQVMEQTRQRMRDLACAWLELETLWDVDRPEDYDRLMATSFDAGGNSPGAGASYIR